MDATTGSAMELASIIPVEAVITGDLDCVGCGYNLRTLPVIGQCSECGLQVEQSLLVLPQRDRAAAAIKLVAWALLVGLLLQCVKPYDIIAAAIMVVATYRLKSLYKSTHMLELGRRIRRLWIVVLCAVVGCAALVVVSFFDWVPNVVHLPSGSSIAVTLQQGQDGMVYVVRYSEVAGIIELSSDTLGRHVIALRDDDGAVLGTSRLAAGQSTAINDADGQTLKLTVDAANKLILQPPGTSKLQRLPRAGVTLVSGPVAGATRPTLLLLVGMATTDFLVMILYIEVCCCLAIRDNSPKLAKRFKVWLWLLLLGTFVIVLVVFLMGVFTAPPMRWGLRPYVIFFVAAFLCCLVAVVGQIVSSFQLSAALRKAPQHWSELAAVPEEELVVPEP